MINLQFACVRSFFAGRVLAAALILAIAGSQSISAQNTNSPPDRSKLSRSVGLDIIKKTVNPDKSVALVFRWSEKGNSMERTVVANDATIVVYNGKIRKLADLTDNDFHAKAVATVGSDGVTAVILRFG